MGKLVSSILSSKGVNILSTNGNNVRVVSAPIAPRDLALIFTILPSFLIKSSKLVYPVEKSIRP